MQKNGLFLKIFLKLLIILLYEIIFLRPIQVELLDKQIKFTFIDLQTLKLAFLIQRNTIKTLVLNK